MRTQGADEKMATTPRLEMIDEGNCSDEQRQVLEARGAQSTLNIVRIFANNPPFLRALGSWSAYFFQHSTLPARDRELLILRCGWITRAEYQWAQHKRLAQAQGLSADEIERVKIGANAQGWSEHEAALIRAADEIHQRNNISDTSWKTLSQNLSPPQLLDVVFVIGQTLMIAYAINVLAIPLDEGLTGF